MRSVAAAPRRRVVRPAPPAGGRRLTTPPEPEPRRWAKAALACLVVACLSLLGPAPPTYDPWAWLIWGREITQGELVTIYGPSWKPLPVFFTTIFALLGDDVAPLLWVAVARTGGLLAIYGAYRLAARIAGWPAGVIAALSLTLSDEFVRQFARGNSEGLLVALCLMAVAVHLGGHRTHALLLGLAAALLRPEVWPFLGLYGLWLAVHRPERRLLVAGVFALIPALWFLPEYFGSGDFLRAAERALRPNEDSAALAERPFLEVFVRAGGLLPVPVWLLALAALGLAMRRARRSRAATTVVALALVASALMVGVALMTEMGFAGNLRYVALPVALVCVLAGVGASWLVAGVRERHGRGAARALAAVLAAAAAPFAVAAAVTFAGSMALVAEEAAFYDDLDRTIAAAGGPAAFDACGSVATGPFEVQVVAWKLGRHGADVAISPQRPGTIIAVRGSSLARHDEFPLVAATERWVVRRACPA